MRMKKLFIVFVLAISLFVPTFAKDSFDCSTLQFIEDIFNQKIECTENNFFENGFVKDAYGDFITTWEGLQIRVIVENNNLKRFDFITLDKQKLIKAWKKALSYAQSKKCKTEDCQIITVSGLQTVKCYTYNHVNLINYFPSDNKFVISPSYF